MNQGLDIMFKVAPRGAIDPFVVMDVMQAANALAATGRDIIHMEVGQPSDPAPAAVIAEAKAALDRDGLGYTLALGVDALRERIAAHYAETYGASVNAANVVVTTGSSAGFLLAFAAAFSAGDRVAAAAPGYPAYRNILKALDIECVAIPVGAETHYQLEASLLDKAGALDGVVVASPANPTGSMLGGESLARLSRHCETHGIRLISDEIYHGITFAAPAVTAVGQGGAGQGGHAVVINSFSKYYAMTGWRVGWMVVPDDLARAIECLQQNMFISAPTLSQLAAIRAFDCRDDLDARVRRYGRNRGILLDGLPKAGFKQFAPADGAFFLYADVSHMTDDSSAFCRRMLEQTGIATTPGIDFDPFNGRRFVRFSFAGATDDMRKAVDRLIGWKK